MTSNYKQAAITNEARSLISAAAGTRLCLKIASMKRVGRSTNDIASICSLRLSQHTPSDTVHALRRVQTETNFTHQSIAINRWFLAPDAA